MIQWLLRSVDDDSANRAYPSPNPWILRFASRLVAAAILKQNSQRWEMGWKDREPIMIDKAQIVQVVLAAGGHRRSVYDIESLGARVLEQEPLIKWIMRAIRRPGVAASCRWCRACHASWQKECVWPSPHVGWPLETLEQCQGQEERS